MIDAGVSPLLGKPIGFLDIIGHSHVADAGSSMPDFGASHKIDSFLQPALFRSPAKGGAICCAHDIADGQVGNGGWATVVREFHRQEAIAWAGSLPPQTLSAAALAGATTISVTAVPASASPGNSFLAVGQGAALEVVRVNGVAGTTLTVSAGTGAPGSTQGLRNAHAAGDPVYVSMDNVGYLPKSQLVVMGYGANDVGDLGPTAVGTVGTTAGSSRGLVPLQHAYRFCLAVMRCCVIYRDTHSSCVYGANWTSTPTTSSASYPAMYGFGTFASFNYHTTTVNGSSLTFSTEPNFPGGTVDIFFLSDASGGGASWNVGVAGATTRTVNGAIDTRNINDYPKYSLGVAPSNKTTAAVYRLTNLNPGVNTITLTAATIQGTAYFLGWGIESPQPPLIFCELDPRPASYALWQGYPYQTRAPLDNNGYSTQTATVAAGAGTAAGSVTLGTAVTIGTTTTGPTAVYPGDTITIGSGANQETRQIVAVDSTTTLHVDSNFVNAHAAGSPCVIGYQDADMAGGGAAAKYGGNPADAQGRASVPGLWARLQSVINEFDQWVQADNPDAVLQKNQLYFDGDLVHYNDAGHALIAAQIIKKLQSMAWSLDQLSKATVPMTKSWIPVYGDQGNPNAGTTYNFLNGWGNYYSASGNSDATSYPRTGYYKDNRTRMVTVQVYAFGQASTPVNSTIFQLPPGYRPAGKIQFAGASGLGPASFEIDASGNVYCTSNASTSFLGFTGSFLAEQ